MTPDEIRKALSALKPSKITPAGIARELNKSPTAIHLVIDGKSNSYAIKEYIADCLNLPVKSVFSVKSDPTKKGRPMTNGIKAA